jgi:hypothetical protein
MQHISLSSQHDKSNNNNNNNNDPFVGIISSPFFTWKAGLSSGLNSNPEELTNSLFLIPKLIMVEFDGRLLVRSEASHLIAVTAHNFIRSLRSLNQPKLSSVLLSSFLLTPYTNWISFYVCVTKYIGWHMKKTAVTTTFSCFIPVLQLNYKYMMDCKSYFLHRHPESLTSW